ncbi:uncharacterized protein LOC100246529 isoform X1 [Vitis vinifera]|uniref:uncharacterized protein LOC100246529 isoform X1 n=1 Tax=Vitis vinifera TaxID=29760 RepID=UPI0008FF9A56|nr:uncharacterized protein LOC100246529 isoform X1 [Vitis vinifera]XP_019075768.1 uncharacterized protein LOC100246529 isoform X1 [Vitis vinifera]|eukprot:XP_002270853.2 PREDICTED: bifunctional epoxide hydrolase 2 [Vitis vinifera]
MEGIEHTTVRANGINIHLAEKGQGPIILLLHGFPEFWYSWRHQIHALASLGYRAVAPDLRGYGDSDAPADVDSYTYFHLVGDLIGVLDAIGADKVFVVGHDWGAFIGWNLCLFRPDRVKALVNLSVSFSPRNAMNKPLQTFRALYGDDYYICRFQEPGAIETEFAEIGIDKVLKYFLTSLPAGPLFLPKGKALRDQLGIPITLPSWLSEEELNYYVTKYENTGFTGGLNYYRNLDLSWELTAPWTGSQVEVPAKFIVGDLDLTYNTPGFNESMTFDELKKHVPLLEEVVVMKGVGHFLQEEKADEINQHIHAFFQRILLLVLERPECKHRLPPERPDAENFGEISSLVWR